MQKTVGRAALIQWRTEQGLLQRELCDLALVRHGWVLEQSTVSGWETGDQKPSGPSRALLQQLTMGRVRVESWDEVAS